jgi:hypothetical protein
LIPRNAATEHALRPGRSLPDAEASGTITLAAAVGPIEAKRRRVEGDAPFLKVSE